MWTDPSSFSYRKRKTDYTTPSPRKNVYTTPIELEKNRRIGYATPSSFSYRTRKIDYTTPSPRKMSIQPPAGKILQFENGIAVLCRKAEKLPLDHFRNTTPAIATNSEHCIRANIVRQIFHYLNQIGQVRSG